MRLMRVTTGVLAALAGGCADSGPLEVEVVTPGWLHDPIRIEFSEPVRSTEQATFLRWPDAHLEDDAGALIATTTSSTSATADGVGTIDLRVHEDVFHAGATRVVVGEATNGDTTLTTPSVEWTIDPWVEETVPFELGEAPSRIIMLGGTSDLWAARSEGIVAAIWSAPGTDGPALHTAVRDEFAVWSTATSLEGWTDPITASEGPLWAIAAQCGSGGICVAWANATATPWFDWNVIEAAGVGAPASIALGGALLVVGQRTTEIEVERYESSTWQRLGSIPATEVIGRPAIGVPSPDRPIVAFLDRIAPDQVELRVLAFSGDEWTPWASLPVTAPEGDVQLAIRGNDAYLAWNDGGPRYGTLSPAGIADIAAPSGATAARVDLIAVNAHGDLIASWIENDDTAQLARYRRFAWDEIADPRQGGSVGASLGLWRDRVPVIGWADGGTLRVGLLNGQTR